MLVKPNLYTFLQFNEEYHLEKIPVNYGGLQWAWACQEMSVKIYDVSATNADLRRLKRTEGRTRVISIRNVIATRAKSGMKRAYCTSDCGSKSWGSNPPHPLLCSFPMTFFMSRSRRKAPEGGGRSIAKGAKSAI